METNMEHANYLLSATNYLSKVPSNVLRTHLNILCSNFMRLKKITLGTKRMNSKSYCMYCKTPWQHGLFKVKVLPTVKTGKKMKKILKKKASGKVLSPIQSKLINSVFSGNTVVLKCENCNKSSRFKVTKMKPVNDCLPTPGDEPNLIGQNKKKKKKKKDMYCGLNKKIINNVNSFSKLSINHGVKTPPHHYGDGDSTFVTSHDKGLINLELNSGKRKREEETVPDIVECSLSKKMTNKKQKKSFIKYNPLQISPLGVPYNSSIMKSNQSDVDSELQNRKSNQRVNHILRKKKNIPNKLINQFSNENSKSNKIKLKKLNHWKKLVSEDNTASATGSSLQDFLSSL